MINPISPQFVYVIHQDKIKDIERQIEQMRIAKEQRALGIGVSLEQKPTWYAEVSQWMKVKFFNHAPVIQRTASQPEPVQKPCAGVPC